MGDLIVSTSNEQYDPPLVDVTAEAVHPHKELQMLDERSHKHAARYYWEELKLLEPAYLMSAIWGELVD